MERVEQQLEHVRWQQLQEWLGMQKKSWFEPCREMQE